MEASGGDDGHGSKQPRSGVVRRTNRGWAALDGARRSRWGGAGGRAGGRHGRHGQHDRAARAAEWREWVILTCAGTPGRAVGVGAAAGVDAEICPKEVEQEEWCDACRRSECHRPEGLRLTQAESEGRWRAVRVGMRVSAGRAPRRRPARGSRLRETRPSCQRGHGELGRADEPAWVVSYATS